MPYVPIPEMSPDWREWANAMLKVLGPIIAERGLARPVLLPQYSVAALPPAVQGGTLIFVPDEVGGPTVAFDDGAGAWRRVQDGAVVA